MTRDGYRQMTRDQLIVQAPPPPLSEVRDMIEDRVRTKKNSATYEKWIEKKRKSVMIEKKI
jgi:hypothetical protein